MKLLLDTNVILDVLLARQPHVVASSQVFAAAERGEIIGLIGATTVTTVFYLVAKAHGSPRATQLVQTLLEMFSVAPVTEAVLAHSLKLGFTDFEDAVLCQAALAAGADGIVTRDPRGFTKSPLPVYEPQAVLALLKARSS